MTFFGLAGLALTLGGTPASLVPVLAVAGGLGSGWGASWALGRLTRDAVGVLPEASSHIGREGRSAPSATGRSAARFACQSAGWRLTSLPKPTLKPKFPQRSTVLVVGMRGMTAVVEPTPAALHSAADDNQDSGKEES